MDMFTQRRWPPGICMPPVSYYYSEAAVHHLVVEGACALAGTGTTLYRAALTHVFIDKLNLTSHRMPHCINGGDVLRFDAEAP